MNDFLFESVKLWATLKMIQISFGCGCAAQNKPFICLLTIIFLYSSQFPLFSQLQVWQYTATNKNLWERWEGKELGFDLMLCHQVFMLWTLQWDRMMSNLAHTARLMHLFLPCWHMNYFNLAGRCPMIAATMWHRAAHNSPQAKTHQKSSCYQTDIVLCLTGEETRVNTRRNGDIL